MYTVWIPILLFGFGAVVFLSVGGGKLKEEKFIVGISSTALGVLSLSMFFGVAYIIGGGHPHPQGIEMLSLDVVYYVEARILQEDKDSVVIVVKRVEHPDNGFLLVECDPKKIPNADFIKLVEIGPERKFIPSNQKL